MPLDARACAAPPDHTDQMTALIEAVQQAPDERSARALSNQMWALWARAPDATAQEMLDRGMGLRRVFDLLSARRAFDELIVYCPTYAEGYNQRAFVHFISQDYTAALADLDRALELNPRHIAALSGKALSLFGLGRDAEGQIVLRQALALNPWLPERNLLRPPKGQEL